MRVFVLALCALVIAGTADANEHRSHAVTAAFERSHACPSTGLTHGACPGYIKDHVIALCDGGADSVGNLEWQSRADSLTKDRTECRSDYARAHR